MRLRGDLHIHSSVSDGRDSPEDIVLKAVELGLDVIAVTDHDTFAGGLRAYSYVQQSEVELVVIVGAEVATAEGDILVYCPGKELSHIPRRAFELADAAHEEGCLVVPAHPFDVRRNGIGKLVYKYRWDAIEVYNAHSDPLSNRRAAEAARVMGLPGLANSDAHTVDAIGAAYTLIEAKGDDEEDVLRAIREGRVKPVAGHLSAKAVLSTLQWSVGRRFRSLKDRLRLRKLQELEDEDVW